MGVDKFKPHIFVIPEDDANRAMAIGFRLRMDHMRQMHIAGCAGGWSKALDLLTSEYVNAMERNANTFVVLLIDLDGDIDRTVNARALIPRTFVDRTFILSTLTKPEHLKPDLGSFETIGSKLAEDCRNGVDTTAQHGLLHHNLEELGRLRQYVLPFLLKPA